MTTAMKRSTFINKHPDSANVSRSTPEERRRINERNREHRNIRKRPDRSRDISSRQAELKSPGADDVRDLVVLGKQLTLGQGRERLGMQHVSGEPASGPGGLIDPFESAPIPINVDVLRLLRYYKESYYSLLWGNISVLLEGRIEAVGLNRCSPEGVIFECMQNKARMYSLLAGAASHLQHETDADKGIKPFSVIQRGIVSLREELQAKHDRLDGEVLLNAIHLYLAARACHQGQAARLHLDGARSILRQIRTQRAVIHGPLAGMIAFIDIDTAHELLRGLPQHCPKLKNLKSDHVLSFEEIQAMGPEQRP